MLDFLLFENFILANHHRIDVILIAKMLKSQGKQVAIFDIYHDEDDDLDDIPVIHWQSKHKIPDCTWMTRKHSIWETIFKSIQFQYQQYLYMKEVKSFIEDKSDNFYCGSYHNGMSTVLFSINKPCYWWGLRSERIHFSWKKLIHSPILGIQIWLKRKIFLNNPLQRLFVSNVIIKDEHERLGIPHNRMVIREERCVERKDNPHYDKLNNTFSFLTIGQLRNDKRIDYTVKEFLKYNNKSCMYILAGTSQLGYEKIIEKSITGHDSIIRINEFMDYFKFNELIAQSHFVVFADKKQKGCVTNGTMLEAFINYRPIIAPNYDPYKYYVEKYGIGILYNPYIEGELAIAMKKAIEIGINNFEKKIDKFLETLMFDKLSKELIDQINNL